MGRYDALKVPTKLTDFVSTGKVRIFKITAMQDFGVADFDFSAEGGKVFDIEVANFNGAIMDGKYTLSSYGYGILSKSPNYDDKSYGNGELHIIDQWIFESEFEAVNE